MSSQPKLIQTMAPRRFLLRMILMCLTAAVALATLPAQAQNIDTLRKQAKAGDAEAQYQLASAYLSGSGGASKDLKQGVQWLRKAADLEHAAAQYALWVMYRSGFPPEIPKDPAQGLPWLRKSADHGYSTAQYNLGLLYRNGDQETGVPQKPHEAATWFRKAARQPGSTKSQASLAEMLQQGLITKQEANWHAPESATSVPPKPAKSGAPPFSLAEVETGLKGSITSKRMAALVQQFGVDFKLSDDAQKRLTDAGADPDLLQVISTSQSGL